MVMKQIDFADIQKKHGKDLAEGVYKLTPVIADFSAATHVYGDYDCEIFKRVDGEFRLKYVDATDATVIVDPTA